MVSFRDHTNTVSAQTDLWAIKDFKAAQFLAVERISAWLNKRETL